MWNSKDSVEYVVTIVACALTGRSGCHESRGWGREQIYGGPGEPLEGEVG